MFASILIGATMIAIQAAQVIGTTLNAVSGDLVSALTHSLGFAAVAIVCALLAVTFSAKLTMGLTAVDEAEEISKNSVGVAVTLGVTIIAVSMFVAPAVRGLLVNLIPYQTTVVGDFLQE